MNSLKNAIPLGIVILLVVLSVLVVAPKGNFPLNDDWVYGYSVHQLFEHHTLKLSDWVAPTMVFHVWWGFLWCALFGHFSFSLLRLATVSLGLIGLIYFYWLLKKLGNNARIACMGTLVLALNPLWFVLSLSFMTDVSYLSVSLISVYYYYLGLEERKDSYLLAGSFFAAAAYLTRQLGIIIPLGVVTYVFFKKENSWHTLALICCAPLLAVAGHRYWIYYIHGLTWAYITAQDLKIGFDRLFYKGIGSLFYAGLFIAPFSLSFLFSKKDNQKPLSVGKQFIVFFLGMVLILYLLTSGAMPYFENTLTRAGLGTVTVHDLSFKPGGVFAWAWLWTALTTVSGVSLLVFLSTWLREARFDRQWFLFSFVFLGQFLASMFRYKFFDRYILVLLPLLIILCAGMLNKRRYSIAVFAVALSVLGLYSTIGTRDYFSWNRAKWEAGKALVQAGYNPNEIANGFDWDGWHTFQDNMEMLKTQMPVANIGEWDWQRLNPYKVMVSFKPGENEKSIVLKIPYTTPLAQGERYLYAKKIQ